MNKKIDLIGRKFGKLKVIEEVSKRKKGQIVWKCLCDCGNIHKVDGYSLRSNHTKSCGCIKIKRLTKHNMCKTTEYKTWTAMLQRCNNPKDKGFPDYGGRGISVSKRWLVFSKFYKDMGERPAGLTLERINNNGDYETFNCKWATCTEQVRNQRLRRDNTSGERGIYYRKDCNRHYQVKIGINNKTKQIGFFNTLEQAKKARKNAELKHWK